MSSQLWDWNLWEKVMHGKLIYRPKSRPVDVMQFTSNNEPGNTNMNAICLWINQGAGVTQYHAYHNGTNIYVPLTRSPGWVPAIVGDWIIKNQDNVYSVCGHDTFAEDYEPVGHVSGA